MPTPFDPSDHHYVPQAYLRNFCYIYNNEERLYAYDRNRLNRLTPSGFASYTPAQVCYAKDLYRLKNHDFMERFDIDDDNVVEKSAFKLYENNLNKILNKLTTYSIERNRRFITLTEAQTLVKTLLNMKKRNPFFFQSINQQNIPRQTNDNIKAEMLADKELWEVRLRSEGLSLHAAFKLLDELIDRPEFADDMLRLSLHQEGQGEVETAVSKIASLLMTKVWTIYETTVDNLFITSDNPGYCLNQAEELFNLNFIEDFAFIFPLSPFHVLCILNQNSDQLIPPSKEVIYQEATPELVQIVNRVSVANAFQFIYSNSRPTLIKVINHWRAFMGDDATNCFPNYKGA